MKIPNGSQSEQLSQQMSPPVSGNSDGNVASYGSQSLPEWLYPTFHGRMDEKTYRLNFFDKPKGVLQFAAPLLSTAAAPLGLGTFPVNVLRYRELGQ